MSFEILASSSGDLPVSKLKPLGVVKQYGSLRILARASSPMDVGLKEHLRQDSLIEPLDAPHLKQIVCMRESFGRP